MGVWGFAFHFGGSWSFAVWVCGFEDGASGFRVWLGVVWRLRTLSVGFTLLRLHMVSEAFTRCALTLRILTPFRFQDA